MAEFIHKGGTKWRVRVFLGRENGRVKYHDTTKEFKNLKARNAYARDIETKRDNGTLDKPDDLSLTTHLNTWLEKKLGKVEPNTHSEYAAILDRYVRPVIGTKLLTDLKPLDIQDVYDRMAQNGLSGRTVRYCHFVLRSALEKAVWWDLLPKNPATYTERPTGQTKEILFLSQDEAVRFLEAAKGDRLAALFYLALANGPRPEECFGLKWNDVDLEKRSVRIQRVLIWRRKEGGWYLRDWPKTASSVRVLPLEPQVIKVLLDHRKRQLLERVRAGNKYQNNDLVFCTPTGEPLSNANVYNRHFKPVLLRSGINRRLNPYSLRHSFATLSLAAGAEAKAVSAALGHKSVKFTLDVYCHVVESMKLEASGKLADVLFKVSKKR